EGFGSHPADSFAALLAANEIIMRDDHDGIASYAAEIASELAESEIGDGSDSVPDEELCLQHFAGSLLPLDGGGNRRTVVEVIVTIENAARVSVPTDDERGLLGRYSIAVKAEWPANPKAPPRGTVAVGYSGPELAKIFAPTHWAGRS